MSSWFSNVLRSIESKILLSVAIIILLFSASIFGLIEFASQKITQIEQALFEEHAAHIVENIYLVSLTEDMTRLSTELLLEIQKNRQISSVQLVLDGKAYGARNGYVEDFTFYKQYNGMSFEITGVNYLKVPLELIQYLSIGTGLFALFTLWLFHKALRRFIRQPILALANTLEFYASDAFKENPRVKTLQQSGTELDILIEKTNQIYQSKLSAIAHEIELRQTVEKAVETKNIFIASMVHDFRTPLIIMQGLLNEHREELNAALLTPLLNQFDDMELMVSNALDLSRIEAGQPVILRLKTVKLFDLVNGVVENFQAEANAKGLYIVVKFSADAQTHLTLDEAKYKQVLRNLVSNAVKYTEQGHIVVSVIGEDKQLITQVTDTGRGISAEQVASIFTPFLRMTNDQIQGTGVGLSFCKLMLNSLGFDLHLNPIAQGAQFQYVFPVEKWVHYPKNDLETHDQSQGKQAMIISADVDLSDYLQANLKNQGFRMSQSLTDLQPHDVLVLHELLEVTSLGTGFNPAFPLSSAALSKALQLAQDRRLEVVLVNNAIKPSINVLKMFGQSHAYILSELTQFSARWNIGLPNTVTQTTAKPKPHLSKMVTQKSILVADDTPAYQALVVEQLKGLGFLKIYTANNGQEALQICRTNPIDIVFMDHMMPIMNGLDSAREIQHHRPTTLIIGFSAALMPDLEGEEKASPMNQVYLKDFKNFSTVFTFIENYFQDPRHD